MRTQFDHQRGSASSSEAKWVEPAKLDHPYGCAIGNQFVEAA